MFEQLFFIYLNCFLRTIFVRIIIFILSYYVVSLQNPYPGFLKFVVSRVLSCRISVAVFVSVGYKKLKTHNH